MSYRPLLVLLLLLTITCCIEKKSPIHNGYLEAIGVNDIGLAKPQPGEWLYEHKEGQNFNDYKRKNPIRLTQKRNKIYLLPIGEFNKKEQALIVLSVSYTHLTLPTTPYV